jgi:glycosyltransferase involved in cell wall biosynthesis
MAARYHRISNFAPIAVIPPPSDNFIQNDLEQGNNKTRRVLYNHRLYQTYGTGDFLDFIESCQDLNFELAVSDPMPNRSSLRSGLNLTPSNFRMRIANIKNAVLYNGNVSREEYAKLILSSRVAFGAFRKACVWSMACIDCMSLGVPVIAPNYGAYPEFVPQELIFNDISAARILMQNLLNDDEFWNYSSKISQMKAAVFESSIIAPQFLDIFNKVY